MCGGDSQSPIRSGWVNRVCFEAGTWGDLPDMLSTVCMEYNELLARADSYWVAGFRMHHRIVNRFTFPYAWAGAGIRLTNVEWAHACQQC